MISDQLEKYDITSKIAKKLAFAWEKADKFQEIIFCIFNLIMTINTAFFSGYVAY